MQGDVQRFSSAPQAVGTRRKYRDPQDHDITRNLMHDKRVIRGSTCQPVVAPSPEDAAEVQRRREANRRRTMRANQTRKRPGTPEPVFGRMHMEVQTDKYLEELTERTVEFEAGTQTDFILVRPSSPLFMPTKIGVDIETQIEEGELFDFDVECEPLLDILLNKTLEQSILEVEEEAELDALRQHQVDDKLRRQQKQLEVQRMVEAERRRSEEMARRMQQHADQRKRDLIAMKKVLSRSIASIHLSSLMDRTLTHLTDAGVFADALDLAVDSSFVPNLLGGVMKQVSRGARDRDLAAGAMQAAVSLRLGKRRHRIEAERRRLAAIDHAEQSRRDEKRRKEQQAKEELERAEREAREKEDRLAALARLPPVREVEIVSLLLGDDDGKALTAEGLHVYIDEQDSVTLQELWQQRQEAQDAGDADMRLFRIAGKMRPGADPGSLSVVGNFRMLGIDEEPHIPKGPGDDDDVNADGPQDINDTSQD